MSRKTKTLLATGLLAAGAASTKNHEVNQAAHNVAGAAKYQLVDLGRWTKEQPSQAEEARREHNEVVRAERLRTAAQDVTSVVLKLPKGLRKPHGEGDQTYIQATLPHEKGKPVFFVNVDASADTKGNIDPDSVTRMNVTKTMPDGTKTSVEIVGETSINLPTKQHWEGHEYVVDGSGRTISESHSDFTDFGSYGATNNPAALGTIDAKTAEESNFLNSASISHDSAALAAEAAASVTHGSRRPQ